MASAALDTTFFIDLYRQEPAAIALCNRIFSGDLAASVSLIVVLELWLGSQVAGEEERFYETLFPYIEQVALTSSAAKLAGTWLRERSGPHG